VRFEGNVKVDKSQLRRERIPKRRASIRGGFKIHNTVSHIITRAPGPAGPSLQRKFCKANLDFLKVLGEGQNV